MDREAAGVRAVQAGDEVEQGGFAGAGGAHEGQKFPGPDGEADVLEDRQDHAAPAIGFIQVGDFHHRGRGEGRVGAHEAFTFTREPSFKEAGGLRTTRSPSLRPAATSTKSFMASPGVTGTSLTQLPVTRKL